MIDRLRNPSRAFAQLRHCHDSGHRLVTSHALQVNRDVEMGCFARRRHLGARSTQGSRLGGQDRDVQL
jgi:hypothetical protein